MVLVWFSRSLRQNLLLVEGVIANLSSPLKGTNNPHSRFFSGSFNAAQPEAEALMNTQISLQQVVFRGQTP